MSENSLLEKIRVFKIDEVKESLRDGDIFAEFLSKEWTKLFQELTDSITPEVVKQMFPVKHIDGKTIEEYLYELNISADELYVCVSPSLKNFPVKYKSNG